MHDGVIYVGDNATGSVLAFDDTGHLLAQMDTGLGEGALMGIEVGPDHKLYLVDGTGNEVLRLGNSVSSHCVPPDGETVCSP